MSYVGSKWNTYDTVHPDVSIILAAFDHVLSVDEESTKWLMARGLPIDRLLIENKIVQYGIACQAAVHNDCTMTLYVLLARKYGPDYLSTQPKLLRQLLATAIDKGAPDMTGYLIKQAANQYQVERFYAHIPVHAMQCGLQVIADGLGTTADMEAICAAVKCDADITCVHDQILRYVLQSEQLFRECHKNDLPLIPDRVSDHFLAEMVNPEQDDLWHGYQLMWDQYSAYIPTAGIFAAVDQMPYYCHDQSCGSRWQLALRIDPEACCYIATEIDISRKLVELMAIGQGELDAFLNQYPARTCTDHPDGHYLRISASDNLAMVYAATDSTLREQGRAVSAIESLIEASKRNSIPGAYLSYYLHQQMLLIVDSPVAKRNGEGPRKAVPPIKYCGLNIVAIDISQARMPSQSQIMAACEQCTELNQLAWRKNHDLSVETMATMLSAHYTPEIARRR